MKNISTIYLIFFVLLAFHGSVRSINPSPTASSGWGASESVTANTLHGKWLNIEGKRIWEFKEDGKLLFYSLREQGIQSAPIPYSHEAKKLELEMRPGSIQQFEIIELDDVKMRLYDKKQKQAFHFIHLRTQQSERDIKKRLTNQCYQITERESEEDIRVMAFRKSGRWQKIIGRDLVPEDSKWSVKNMQGFNFILLDQIMTYLIVTLDDENILLGNMAGDGQLLPYQKINTDPIALNKHIPGKWNFRINNRNAAPALQLKLKKSGSGTWHSLNKKEKIPITWHIKNGIPILNIYQNGNRNVDYLILEYGEDQLVLEELGTEEFRGGKWIMYGR